MRVPQDEEHFVQLLLVAPALNQTVGSKLAGPEIFQNLALLLRLAKRIIPTVPLLRLQARARGIAPQRR